MDLGILSDTLGYLLRRASRDIDRRYQQHFRVLDLSSPQFAALILIDRNEQCTLGDLVRPLGIGQNNMAGLIGELIDKGWVRKETSASDRRARTLTLTDAGRALLADAMSVHARFVDEYSARLGPQRVRDLAQLLQGFEDT